MKTKLILKLFLVVLSFILISCEVPTEPEVETPQTSIFLGTWTEAFDTSTAEKKDYWEDDLFPGEFRPPFTMVFYTDSTWVSNLDMHIFMGGDIDYYTYDADVLYSIEKLDDWGNFDTTYQQRYRMSNDTLQLYYDSTRTKYKPVWIKQ